MKLSQAYEFNLLVKERDELREARTVASTGQGLGVTIKGRYQDDAMIDAIKLAVVAEFDRRIAILDAKFVALGIEIDG